MAFGRRQNIGGNRRLWPALPKRETAHAPGEVDDHLEPAKRLNSKTANPRADPRPTQGHCWLIDRRW
jgi:hypothetical protein